LFDVKGFAHPGGADRLDEPEIRAQLAQYELAIAPGYPTPQPACDLGVRVERVAPITLLEADECLPRAAARRALGLARGRIALLSAGGGANAEAHSMMRQAVPWLRRAGFAAVFVANGQLLRGSADDALPGPVPLQLYLAAFDLAIAAAGYNTAHELAKQGVRAVLWAEEREFDDQAARAQRFEHAGLAVALPSWSRRALVEAVTHARTLDRPSLEPGGARKAARLVLEAVV